MSSLAKSLFNKTFSNKSETLPVENSMSITAIALSPDSALMIAVNEGNVLFFVISTEYI